MSIEVAVSIFLLAATVVAAFFTGVQATAARTANKLAAQSAAEAAETLADVLRVSGYRGEAKFSETALGLNLKSDLVRMVRFEVNKARPDAYFALANVGAGDAFNVTISSVEPIKARFDVATVAEELSEYSLAMKFKTTVPRVRAGSHVAVLAMWPQEHDVAGESLVAELEWQSVEGGQMRQHSASLTLSRWTSYEYRVPPVRGQLR